MSDEKKVIEFGGRKELDPNDAANYRAKIDAAKKAGGVNSLKGSEPLGGVPRPQMPVLRNQPIRQNQADPSDGGGVVPRPQGSPLLRPETAQQLKEMADAQVRQAEQEKAAEKAAEEPKKDDEDLLEMFDFAGKSEAERILNNKKRRQDIESRCEEMRFEDLLIKNEVQQLVPILPNRFEVLYRSSTPEEQMFIKRYISRETGVNDSYLMEKYNLCLLALSLVAINGVLLPEHRNAEGGVDEKNFELKLKTIAKKSGYVVADLGLNYIWFDLRVRKLLNPDDLKNG